MGGRPGRHRRAGFCVRGASLLFGAVDIGVECFRLRLQLRRGLITSRGKTKPGKKVKVENLDPTLRLDLLAMSEQTQYQGNGRNIFVSQAEDIPIPIAKGNTDNKQKEAEIQQYQLPQAPQQTPIPLKFYGFASRPGEPKKIFLKLNEDVFVAGEGEIVDRRYKVIRITNTFVEIQDVVNSGPPQNIPLTQG